MWFMYFSKTNLTDGMSTPQWYLYSNIRESQMVFVKKWLVLDKSAGVNSEDEEDR